MNAKLRLRLIALLGLSVLAGVPSGRLSAGEVVTAADGNGGTLWDTLEGYTYDQRAQFQAGANRLSAILDSQIRRLRAKRASMTTDTKDWDLAMKAVDDARVLLTGKLRAVGNADTPDKWADEKTKFGDAWKRSQDAVDKMNRTVTS